MAIQTLRELVAPPDHLPHPDAEAVAVAEGVVGLPLPSDYLDFATTYGTGSFRGGGFSFWIWNPLRPDYPAIIEQETEDWLLNWVIEPEDYPAHIHPARPGFLPLGADVNGGKIAYLTRGEPDQWPVATKKPRSRFQIFEMPLTKFLVKIFGGLLQPEILTDTGFPTNAKGIVFLAGGQFRPHREK